MANDNENKKPAKCYNSFACISVVAIILFILGSTMYDMLVTKPGIRSSISDIKVELRTINERLDNPRIVPLEIQQNAILPDSVDNK